MGILAVMSEDEVRGNGLLQFLEDCLHLGARKGHESVLKGFKKWPVQSIRAGKQRGCAFRLHGTRSNSTEHDPVEHAAWIMLGQTENCSAAANFDVVRVCSETQDLDGRCPIIGQS